MYRSSFLRSTLLPSMTKSTTYTSTSTSTFTSAYMMSNRYMTGRNNNNASNSNKTNSGGGSSFSGVPKSMDWLVTWYPRRGGEFLGDMIAGHNLFIADIPKKYDAKHARHFSLVESLAMTPLFALSNVHYVSSYCQYPNRTKLLEPIMMELTRKAEAQQEWCAVVTKTSPMDAIFWRFGMLSLQLVLYPLWLLIASIAPQLVHATMERINHILCQKYKTIGNDKAPAFVMKCAELSSNSESFHSQHLSLPTDYGAAVLLFLLVLYLTS